MNQLINYLRQNEITKQNLLKLRSRIMYPKLYWSLKDNIYIVYTMGKVGSSTIYRTLQTELKVANVFHIHYLSHQFLEKRHSSVSDNHPYVKQAKQIQKLKSIPGKRFQIITVVRDPIAKKVSGFFQNPYLYGLTQQQLLTISPHDACDLIVKNRMKFYDAVEWFDKEFENFTGVDIYQQSFNHSDKQQLISADNLNILILRIEDFKDKKSLLLNLQKFIGTSIQKIINANVTQDKPVAELNKQVVKLITFPADFVNDIYTYRYCQHFYTTAEINQFKLKWTGSKG